MAKKKGSLSRPGSRAGSENDDTASFSTASQKSFGGRNGSSYDLELEEIEDDPFNENVEKLYEKRYSTREEGLQGLIGLLTSQWQYEEAVFRQETFSQMFMGSLKRGGPKESGLAARALGLHVITLGASDISERIFKEALPTLEPIILTGKTADSRVAAVDALGMLCFVGSEGPHETLPTMALLAKAFTRGVPKVQAAALRGWSLLLTTVPASCMDSDFVESNIRVLATLLHSQDVEVRSAAGEAVALLYDTCGLAELPESPVDMSGMAAAAAALSSPAKAAYGRPPLPPSARKNGNASSPSPAAAPTSPSKAAVPAGPAQQEEEGLLNGSAAAANGRAQVAAEAAAGDAEEAATLRQAQREQQKEEGQDDDGGVVGSLELGEEGQGDSGVAGSLELEEVNKEEERPTLDTGCLLPSAAALRAAAAGEGLHGSDEEDEGHMAAGGVPVKRLEDIVSRMKDLAKNRGDASRRSRKERASQRGTFRELCNIVEAGSVSTQKIKLRHGDVLVVESLPATVRLNAMRRFLAEGFQAHLQDNVLLHQVFNFQPRVERPEKLSAWEKRMYRSPASAESKARSQQRKKDRATMAAYKGSMMEGE